MEFSSEGMFQRLTFTVAELWAILLLFESSLRIGAVAGGIVLSIDWAPTWGSTATSGPCTGRSAVFMWELPCFRRLPQVFGCCGDWR